MANVNKEDFDALHEKVDLIAQDISFIKGKMEGERKTNSDWYTRVLAIVAMIISGLVAWFK